MTTMIELRTSLNLDTTSFAATINITPQMVERIENGDVNPGKDVIEKVKEVYGADIEQTAAKEAEGRTRVTEKTPVEKIKETVASAAKAVAGLAAKAVDMVKMKKTTIILQSPTGNEITLEDIENRVVDADAVYIRIDENRAYWVKDEETGSVELW